MPRSHPRLRSLTWPTASTASTAWRARTAACAAALLVAACGGGSSGAAEGVAKTEEAGDAAGVAAAAPLAGATPVTAAATAAGTVVARFTPSDADWPNPERGFYRWSWTKLNALSASDMQDAYEQGYRLLYTPLDLSSYRSRELPASLLTRLDTSFARARAAGVKLIVRASYNYPESETEYRNVKDAPLSRVLGHIAQLKPVLQRNADVIAFVQAGFIGAWGEWHTSSNQLTTPANRTQVRDALLDAVPASRFVQLRTPAYVMDWAPTLSTLAAVLGGAYRMGVHNDCFLASTTDVGTYDENAGRRATQRDYVDRLGDLAPFGGETCDPADEDQPTPRTTCPDILAEGARYNLTYLNDEYYRDLFHTQWEQGGCMAEVRRRMGYRLEWVQAEHADAVGRGEDLAVALTVRNTGWARLFNPRAMQLVLRDGAGAVHRLPASGADPRTWAAGSETAETVRSTVPADLPAGTYEVLLALPDGDARLAADARFAVRPANADAPAAGQRWDAALGAFALGTRVLVR